LADRLRELIARHASLQRQTCTCKHCLYLEEAAAALDRTEALEQALRKARNWLRSIDGTREMVEELDVALLALILPETKDPR
jgi:hypothetical protein